MPRTALALFAAFAVGCGGVVWDAAELSQRQPGLADLDVGHLGDATPYVFAGADTATFFLCRWPLGEPIGVAWPPAANELERELLGRALRAWEDAVPGLRFRPGAAQAAVRIRFAGESGPGASAGVDCAVAGAGSGATVDARLVAADLLLRRRIRDSLGGEIALSEAELLGSALHELGHALGFQGHARRGSSVLVASVDEVRRVGRRVLRGEPLDEPGVAALYALPQGFVVERRKLRAGATATLDALAAIARGRSLAGPRVRVGDRAARIAWGRPEPELAIYIKDPRAFARKQIAFELRSGASEPLSRAPDPAPGPWPADLRRMRIRPGS